MKALDYFNSRSNSWEMLCNLLLPKVHRALSHVSSIDGALRATMLQRIIVYIASIYQFPASRMPYAYRYGGWNMRKCAVELCTAPHCLPQAATGKGKIIYIL